MTQDEFDRIEINVTFGKAAMAQIFVVTVAGQIVALAAVSALARKIKKEQNEKENK
jgi:hypothetical protein